MARILLLITFMAWAVSAWAAGPEGPVLSLEEAIALARDNNPTLKNAKIEIAKVGDDVEATRSQQFPNITLNAAEVHNLIDQDYEYEQGAFGTVNGTAIPEQDVDIETSSDFTTIFSAKVTQPLSDLYGLGLAIDKLETDQRIARQALLGERQSVDTEVKRLYFDVLQTQSALAAATQSIAFYVELDRLVDNYVAAGKELEYQSLDVKARLAKAEHEALRERNTIATEKEQLNDLMGRPAEIAFQVAPMPQFDQIAMDQTAAQDLALTQRPEIKGARLKVRSAEYQVRLKEFTYVPEVGLSASYSYRDTDLLPQEEAIIGLFLKWEFFDWGRRSDEISKVRRGLNQTKNDVRRTEADVISDVNKSIRELENKRDLLRVVRLAQAAAKEKLRVVMNKYRVQAVLLDDVLQAESELSEATADEAKALLGIWTAWADLEKAIGEG
jgi:outer membrane protein TolC